jgi:prepilin-type N-terminal cleavage/methylation domain-containing protein
MFRLLSPQRRRSRPGRQGFTLLELIVVIGILITLAGILVPILPNLLARSSYAVGATNTGELTKEIFTYRTLNGTFPDGYDVLANADGSGLATTVINGTLPTGFTVGPLTGAGGVTSLNLAGIKNVYSMDTTAGHATFFTSANSTSSPIASTTNFLQIAPATLQTMFGQGVSAASGVAYVALGIGNNCTLVGARKGGVQEAPLRGVLVDANGNPLTTSANAPEDPTNAYARFVAIFKVDANGVKPASLVCCAALDPTAGILTTDQFVNEYYKNQTGSQ